MIVINIDDIVTLKFHGMLIFEVKSSIQKKNAQKSTQRCASKTCKICRSCKTCKTVETVLTVLTVLTILTIVETVETEKLTG